MKPVYGNGVASEGEELQSVLLWTRGASWDNRQMAEAATSETRKEMIRGGFSPRDGSSWRSVSSQEETAELEGFAELQREVVESGSEPEVARSFYNHHMKEWARRDFAEAARWAATYLKGKEGMGTAAALFGEATRAGFEGVETAWRELPEGNLKTMALFNMPRMAPPERQPRVRALLDELPPGGAAKLRGQVSP